MSSPTKYTVFVLLVNIIFWRGFSPCQANALRLTECEFKNGTLACQDVPVAQASIRQPILLDQLEIAFIIAVVAAILFIFVCCICPTTKYCNTNEGTCWGGLDREKYMRGLLYPPIPPVGDEGDDDLKNKINAISDSGTNVDNRNSSEIQPSDTLITTSVASLESNTEMENPKLPKKKGQSPVDCVTQVCACV
ncbi:unnamed protein product [Orchesella dallaii]|uniref:Uncharacterized protein n=1 Tax=Orchesella dallaii TaxID=48710 RepID=A0ABP1S8Z3_9HEXA